MPNPGMTQDPVVVIGAGVAGLAAARRLRAAGIPTILIEAAARPGGRARTATLAGHPFDHGASWLHDAERNPLAAMATPQDGLTDSDRDRAERVTIQGRPATAPELAGYEAAWSAIDTVTAPALRGPDITLREALRPMAADPWEPLVALWEGAIIAAVDAHRLSLRDWHRNRLSGTNAVLPEGLGAYVLRKLPTEITLQTPATAIAWHGPNSGPNSGPAVTVTTPSGTIRARAAIVTVSTGVLAAGSIRFDPPLPPEVQHAIHALPMGLLSKVAFTAAGQNRLGLPDNAQLVDRDGSMTFNAWPLARPHIIGFLGGDTAWHAATRPGTATDLARTEFRRVMGEDALRGLNAETVETTWGTDPNTRGAYAYAAPGNADCRKTLAEAYPAERLLFAGEATRTDGLAGTVGGAWLSGTQAAERILGTQAAERILGTQAAERVPATAAPAAVPTGSP